MALAQKARQLSKGMGAKAVKAPAKIAKPTKKATPEKVKAALAQPQQKLIEKAKAALKREKPVKAAVAVVKPAKEMKPAKEVKALKEVKVAKAAPAVVAPAPVTADPKPISKAKARKISIEASANEAASALAAKWNALFKKADQIETKPYNMKATFEEKSAITHKLLGWGYILANRNDRLEVLFKDGIKYLISNYKP